MSGILNSIKEFFRPLSGAQKTLFGLLSVGVIALIALLFHWALEPRYAVLFHSLSSDSAQTIVKGLKSSNTPYKLTDNGHTIRVPQSKVYDLRLKYADDESTGSNYKGYKIFDNNTLGMTDFMQRVDKKRALEGELARTINSLDEVKSSRVHLVLPKRSPFQESKVKPSASVVLNLKLNKQLSDKQVEGITALIAGSVAKLTPKEVVVLDQNGNQISKNKSKSALASASSEQMRVRQAAENYLKQKGQSMLNRVVGPGNSIVRVSTQHNFNKITRQSNTVDPNSRTIISEEQNQLQKSNKTQQSNTSTIVPPKSRTKPKTTAAQKNKSTVQVKNYVVSRTKENMKNMVGGITHISVSVLLNYQKKKIKTKNGATKTKFVPRSKKQIAKIKQVIHSALGLRNKRGDNITVTQIKFQNANGVKAPPASFMGNFSIYEIFRWIIVAIVAGVIGFLMYRTSQKMKEGGLDINNLLQEATNGPSGQNYLEGDTQEDIYAQKLSDQAQDQLEESSEENQDINEFIENNTTQAAQLVRRMMKQEL